MLRRISRDESGYSLAEVVVAVLLLGIAIIPMAGMFDAGLRAATVGSDYDKARTLANKQLERAKTLSYESVRASFPVAGSAPTASGVYASGPQNDVAFPNFTYTVRKAYAGMNKVGIVEDPGAKTMMTVTVTVRWDGGKSYSSTGLVAK